RKYVDQYLKYGRKGYRVSPGDRKMLLELFDRGGFTEGYYQEHNGRDMVVYKEKPAFREGNQELFDYLDRMYVDHLLQEPVRGTASLEPGKAAKLTLECLSVPGEDGKPVSVTVSGQIVQEALNQPMARDKVAKQLQKTGNTPFAFDELNVQLTGNVFLPVQSLNELRRNGVEALETKILSGKRRSLDAEVERQQERKQERRQEGQERQMRDNQEEEALESMSPRFIASLEEQNQLSPALEHQDVDEIYLDADGFPFSCWKETAAACHQAGKQCLLMMPHIFRTEAIRYFESCREEFLQAGFDGVVVRSLEEVEWLKQLQPLSADHSSDAADSRLMPMVFDGSLYTWNHLSNQVMLDAGAFRITMPAELNSRELKAKGCAGQELLVYGALPMMVSAQCIRKTTEGCSRRREVLYLKDRTGKQMPVKNHCTFCYNTIYNASPVALLGQEELVKSLKPGAVRLQFTTESPKEVERCLDAFAAGFLHGCRAEMPCGEFTRGHIKRGVE
ncbi:MAG: DUF3656 domain-containing protein, partial [Lachnospiraceae bacterium]|nr:DUF3656 domain-containing protein [Lachnospiraceae bacterium]